MGARFLLLFVLPVFLAAFGWFPAAAYSQDGYNYTCTSPNGEFFESTVPCGSYYDYDYDSPGYGYFDFDFDNHHHHDFDRDRDRDSRGREGAQPGGGARGDGAMHEGGGMSEAPSHAAPQRR